MPGDEVCMLYGCFHLNVFRPKGKYYLFIHRLRAQNWLPLPEIPVLVGRGEVSQDSMVRDVLDCRIRLAGSDG